MRRVRTYIGSEVLRSRETEDDDGRTDDEHGIRQSQRQDDDDSDQPRLVRRVQCHTGRHAVERLGADRPERKRGQNEADQRQRDDDGSGTTSRRQRSDLEWMNYGDQSLDGDRHRYPGRQQLTTASKLSTNCHR